MQQWETAAAHFAVATEAHEHLGAQPLTALAKFEWGRTLRRQDPTNPRAAVLIDQALAIAGNIGMKRLEEMSEHEHAGAAASPNAGFVKEGDHWAAAFEGKVVRLKDSRGCAYIAQLLSRPGEAVAAVVLAKPTRGAAPSEEQARIAVRKAISVVLRALATQHPALGNHLESSLRTGRHCVYEPEKLVVRSV